MAERRSGSDDEVNPIDQLVDLFVYAPIGLLYEYEDVVPKLVKRGKSQVQLAKVLGQLAVRGRNANLEFEDVAGAATTVVARAVTEIGQMIGLAPDSKEQEKPPPPPRPEAEPQPPPPEADGVIDVVELDDVVEADGDEADEADDTDGGAEESAQLPIARYDELKAKEIIPLLESLSAEQRAVVRSHEELTRARKTIIAKLDRLDG